MGSSVCLGCVNYDWTMGPVTWLPVVSKVRKKNALGVCASGMPGLLSLSALPPFCIT